MVHMVIIPIKGKKQTNRIAEINSHLTKMLACIKNLHLLRSGQVTGTGKEKHAHGACSTALPDPVLSASQCDTGMNTSLAKFSITMEATALLKAGWLPRITLSISDFFFLN